MASRKWEEARALRRARRAGMPQQPRSATGLIVKRDHQGGEVLVECCKRCTETATTALAATREEERRAAARAATKAGRVAKKTKNTKREAKS